MEKIKVGLSKTGKPQQTFKGKNFILHPGERYFSNGSLKMHVYVWEQVNLVEVPKGFHIHHKDENTWNNAPDNLELKAFSEHLSEHGKLRSQKFPEWYKEFHAKGIEAAKAWHASADGIEWHKAHAANNKFGVFDLPEIPCQVCSSIFKPKTKAAKFCSNNCKSTQRRSLGLDNVERTCTVCGKIFSATKYSSQEKCRRGCGSMRSKYK